MNKEINEYWKIKTLNEHLHILKASNLKTKVTRDEIYDVERTIRLLEQGMEQGKLQAEKDFYLNKQPKAVAKLIEMAKEKGKLEQKKEIENKLIIIQEKIRQYWMKNIENRNARFYLGLVEEEIKQLSKEIGGIGK